MHTLFTVMVDGSLVSKHQSSPVPTSVLHEILGWIQKGVTMENIVKQLRKGTVPSGYQVHTWKPGEKSRSM